VPLVEQGLLTLPEHLGSFLVLSGVNVTRSLVLWVCFVDRCMPVCSLFLVEYYIISMIKIYPEKETDINK
jgi:hypothetical protein